MKSVVLLFNTSCVYEIVILNYFLKFTGKDVVFTSLDGKSITSMEGYSMNVDKKLSEIDFKDVELMIVPGGDISEISSSYVYDYLNKVKDNGGLISAICAGVDVLDNAGILKGIDSTHSTEQNFVVTDSVITSRANTYVDFAIEVAKKMDLFEDEADLQETLDFWKEYKRMD